VLYTEKVSYTNIGPIAHRNRTALNGGGRDKVEVGIRRGSGGRDKVEVGIRWR